MDERHCVNDLTHEQYGHSLRKVKVRVNNSVEQLTSLNPTWNKATSEIYWLGIKESDGGGMGVRMGVMYVCV